MMSNSPITTSQFFLANQIQPEQKIEQSFSFLCFFFRESKPGLSTSQTNNYYELDLSMNDLQTLVSDSIDESFTAELRIT